MKVMQALALAAVGLGLAGAARAQTTVELGEWYMCAPMGHPALKSMVFAEKPQALGEIRNYNFFFTTIMSAGGMYPMDRVIDLDATYKGPLTADSQGVEAEVKWRKVSTSEGFMRGNKIIAFFSTWVSVPQDCTGQMIVRSYRNRGYNATESVAVNGAFLQSKRAEKQNPPVTHPVSGQSVTLKKGWNHVYARHLVGWGGLENSMALSLAPEIASQVVVSAEPPAEVGRRFTISGQREGDGAAYTPAPKAEKAKPKPPASVPAGQTKTSPARRISVE